MSAAPIAAAAAATQGFVPFLDGARWLAKRRPQPQLAAAIDLANAVRAGQIAAIYRDGAGHWAELKGAMLDAQIGLETGDIVLPDVPGAAARPAVVMLGAGWDNIGGDLDWPGPVPSDTPEPRPKVELEPEPWDELRHSFSEPKHKAIWAAYHARNRAAQAQLDAWRDREDNRKAACAAYDLAWRQHDELRRRLAPPVEQIIVGAPPAPAVAALFVRLEDVQRFGEPPAPEALTPVETGAAQPSSSKKPGRKTSYDEAAVANLARELVRRHGLPSSQQKIVQAIRATLWPTATDGPSERTLRRVIEKLWKELSEIIPRARPAAGK